jgi:uncharacterized protein (DUF4415 family)
MSRDDSILYTGASSASFATTREDPIRKLRSEQKAERQTKLTPAAEVVAEVIASEKALITHELAQLPLNVSTTTEDVKQLLMAYQRNLRFIDNFQTKINNALRKANK